MGAGPFVLLEGNTTAHAPCLGTQFQDGLRRPLDEDPTMAAGMAMPGRHHLGGGIEGDLAPTGPLAPPPLQVGQPLHGQGQQGRLGGVAQGAPVTTVAFGRHQLGVVAQGHGLQQGFQHGVQLHLLPILHQGTIRPVADAAHLDPAIVGQPDRGDGHLVTGQGTGLVAADHRGGAQGFHRRQAAHDGTAPRHALHAHGQGNGHGHRQALGHHGHHLADGDHEDVHEGQAAQEAKAQHDDEHGQGRRHQILAELGDAHLEGGLGLYRRGGEAGDLAYLRLQADGHHHGATAPGRDMGAGIDHVVPVCQQGVFRQGLHLLRHRQGLPRQRRLAGLEGRCLQEPGIGPHRVARSEDEEITRHQIPGLDHRLLAIPQNPHPQGRQTLQCRHGAFRPPLLEGADRRVDQHHDQDDHGIPRLAENEGQQGGDEQDVDERALELAEHKPCRGTPPGLGQGIGTEPGPALCSLGLSQAGWLRPQPMQRRRGRQTVPEARVPLSCHRGRRRSC